jgi:hypothetical protein
MLDACLIEVLVFLKSLLGLFGFFRSELLIRRFINSYSACVTKLWVGGYLTKNNMARLRKQLKQQGYSDMTINEILDWYQRK